MIDIRSVNLKDVEYFTKRLLEENGKKGRVLIIKFRDKIKANFYLECPNCSKISSGELEFNKKRHVVTCIHCNKKYIIKRLYNKRIKVS